MQYRLLDSHDSKKGIRDPYPAGEDGNASSYYTADGGEIKLIGKYPENFIKFITIPVSDVQVPDVSVAPNIDFRFIVRFINGNTFDEWTSANFKKDLDAAIQENNPYFRKDKVTIAEIDFNLLNTYTGKGGELTKGNAYAQVNILDTLDTREDMLIHIQWLISDTDDELRNVGEFGVWEYYTGNTSDTLGFAPTANETQYIESNQATPRSISPSSTPRSNQTVTGTRIDDDSNVATPISVNPATTPRSNQTVTTDTRATGSIADTRDTNTVTGTRSGPISPRK